ncbi:MAG: GTPase ObgE [Fimbriimonadales bacterium]
MKPVSFPDVFLDEAVIDVRSGRGGGGSASFRQEKHVPRGGPDGGDGGSGGDVVLVADSNLTTLLDFRFTRKYAAEDGTPGQGDRKYGKSGKSLKLRVPIGTVIKDAHTGEQLADLAYDKARFTAAKGGRGGRGNLHFVSSVRQAPTFAEKGEPADARKLLLELKLMADVGLVGLPNAGKSTLIRSVSAAKPKVGNYPFTTLTPSLGIAKAGDKSFVIADLPGLIEGASEGKGLGHRFLKHADRTRVILHVVECLPVDESDPFGNFKLIESELEKFSSDLAAKPALIAMSKIDLMPDAEQRQDIEKTLASTGLEVFLISAATTAGVEKLLYRLAALLEEQPPEPIVQILEPKPEEEREQDYAIERDEAAYVVTGRSVIRMVAMADLRNPEALRYLHRKLVGAGVIDGLREAGIEEGDTVRIGNLAFTFEDEG